MQYGYFDDLKKEYIITDPKTVFSEILRWAALSHSSEFMIHIQKTDFRDANEKYKSEIHSNEINRFEQLLGDSLKLFSYKV